MTAVRYPGWRTMTSAQRRNAKMETMFERGRMHDLVKRLEAEQAAWPKVGATLCNPAFAKLVERIAYLKAQDRP